MGLRAALLALVLAATAAFVVGVAVERGSACVSDALVPVGAPAAPSAA